MKNLIKSEISSLNPFLIRHTFLEKGKVTQLYYSCIAISDFYLVLPLPQDKKLKTIKIAQIDEQINQVQQWVDITNSQAIEKYNHLNFIPQKEKCDNCSKVRIVFYFKTKKDIEFQFNKPNQKERKQCSTYCSECIKDAKTELAKTAIKESKEKRKQGLTKLANYFSEVERIFEWYERD